MEVIKMPGGGGYQSRPTTTSPQTPAEQLKEELDLLTRTLAQRRAELAALQNDTECLTRITLYLRDHYAREIEAGQHAGMTLADVVVGYLSMERTYTLTPWWGLFWWALTGQRGQKNQRGRV